SGPWIKDLRQIAINEYHLLKSNKKLSYNQCLMLYIGNIDCDEYSVHNILKVIGKNILKLANVARSPLVEKSTLASESYGLTNSCHPDIKITNISYQGDRSL